MWIGKGRALNITKRQIIRTLLLVVAIVILSHLFIVVQSSIAHAGEFSWTNGTKPSVVSNVPGDPAFYCKNLQQTNIVGEAYEKDVCMSGENGQLQFGTYNQTGSINPGAVRFPNENKVYRVDNVCSIPSTCLYLANKDIMVSKYYITRPGFIEPDLVVYRNFSQRLTKITNAKNEVTGYAFDYTNPNYLFKPSADYPSPVGNMGTSDDDRWLVFEEPDRATMLLDMDSFELKRISVEHYQYGIGLNPGMEFDVTNDGRYIAMMGSNTAPQVFEVSDGCGDKVVNGITQQAGPDPNICPSVDLNSFSGDYIEHFRDGTQPKLSDDGGELSFYARSYTVPGRLVTLRASSYMPPPQLDYLALGDSYSSGEGDTEVTSSGQKHYLALTDVNGDYAHDIPREKCHQSWRAYPFLLADSLHLSDDKHEIVACSGATIGDLAGSKKTYEGQYSGGDNNKHRLEDISNAKALQNAALIDFVPGRVRQIEFVKKYKPKVITVGISGNDVGFAKILQDCVGKVNIEDSCDYVDTDEGRASIGEAIANQYKNLTTLYVRLHEASPETKIYAISYPEFISTGGKCGINVRLSKDERLMAEEAVDYLNEIIEKAAQRAGVDYINIENSLNGRRLCDTDSPYVTGIAGHWFFTTSEEQESFHPNNKGNELMSNAIIASLKPDNLLTHQNCPLPFVQDFCPSPSVKEPEPTTYFASAMAAQNRSAKNEQLTNNAATKTKPQRINTDPFILQPGSTANIELHSTPVSLGEYVIQQDGSLSGDITIPPNVPAGYHTLHVYGNTYSGEPIDLIQVIEVRGAQGDIDEDGIPDVSDPCLYVVASGIDADFDSVDDACDPQIDDIQPYRVRNGDIDRGEQAQYMYIERNTHASSVTGVSSDYDPDNDGWAIVASSNNANNSGTPAHFWIDDTKVPHASIRTPDKGCVQLTPASLKVVKPNKTRRLKQEAKNTSTCRSEPPEADSDHDGVPDNQQLIYRARNGNQANSEDPQNIYLERNSTATEAQLGLSDYDHTKPWNILASSQNDTTKATLVKLVMVNDDKGKTQPVVLASKITVNKKGMSTATCIALEPTNTNLIKQAKDDKALRKITIPQGQSCNID